VNRLFNLVLLKLMPFLIGLAVVGAGFLLVTSAGRSEQIVRAKNLVRIMVLAYAATLLSWLLLSVFFSVFGIAKWTGFIPVRGAVSALSATSVVDASENWKDDEWKGYFVEIQSPDNITAIREVIKNTKDTLELRDVQPFGMIEGTTYHILGTGWWNFVCEISVGPEANFSASPQAGIAPFRVDFTDLSGGDIEKWSWDFQSDGVEDSSAQSPSFTYESNGPHTVKLMASGKTGTAVKTDTIHFAPQAAFTASPLRGRAPLTVSFNSSTSSGEITGWLWDFNDPRSGPYHTSTDENTTHTFERPGSYAVKLTVRGHGGKDAKTKLTYIYVYPSPPPPLADFDGGRVIDTLQATFRNSSLLRSPLFGGQGAPQDFVTAWSWDLSGDGTYDDSRAENPTFFYPSRKEPYSVSLKASGPGGTSSAKERADYIAFPPQAHFWAKNPAGSLSQSDPFAVNFSDSSTGTVSGWEWNFGDGVTDVSNNSNPSHGYSANGHFTVGLKAKGPEEPGEDTREEDFYVAIAPRADFEFSSVQLSDPTGPGDCLSSTGCTVGPSGATVTFQNTSKCSGSCVSYWEFGDGGVQTVGGLGPVTYNYNGTSEEYTVRLTVTGPGGGDTMEKKSYIHIAPYVNVTPQKIERTRTIVIDCGKVVSVAPPYGTVFNEAFSGESQPRPYIKEQRWSNGATGGSAVVAFTASGSVEFTATNARGQSDSTSASFTIKENTQVIPCPPPPPAGGGGGGASLGIDAFLAKLPKLKDFLSSFAFFE
jgi:PKD repeat protein